MSPHRITTPRHHQTVGWDPGHMSFAEHRLLLQSDRKSIGNKAAEGNAQVARILAAA